MSLLAELNNDFIIIGLKADSKSISVKVLCDPSFFTFTSPRIAWGRPPKYSTIISCVFENKGDWIVNTPDLFLPDANRLNDESEETLRPIVEGNPSKKYSGNSYISGFTPSASND